MYRRRCSSLLLEKLYIISAAEVDKLEWKGGFEAYFFEFKISFVKDEFKYEHMMIKYESKLGLENSNVVQLLKTCCLCLIYLDKLVESKKYADKQQP